MSKKWFRRLDTNEERDKLRQRYRNKYFNLWMDSKEWDGIEKMQADYIMRKFWEDGTVSAIRIKNTDELAFTPYAPQKYNIYDFPEEVIPINKRGVPFIPNKEMVVGVDIVLGWAQTSHKPIRMTADSIIDRIVDVEMVINTNLIVHKMPWVVAVSEQDKEKVKDLLRRIMADDPVIFAEFNELQLIKELMTGAPYIIDKLYQYKTSLENELLTFLGIDNDSLENDSGYQLVDQVNANNAVINLSSEGILGNLKEFCNQNKNVLQYTMSVKNKIEPTQSVYDQQMDVRGAGNDDHNEEG